MKKILIIIPFFFISPIAQSENVIEEFRGSESVTTPIFLVEAPWLLDWRLDGDYDELIALDISLIEAETGRHIGRVLHTKRKGNGLKLFNYSGRYQLRVSSTLARWTLKIKQIKSEEKELYTPKESKLKKNNPFR
ncbi:MAG: hypothetical protein CMO97_05350 [Woeseia sp.]|nr:hypothetical protein [Woeseia sp.]|tara:strand:- start:2085 stop:2489 length:405 start_codon:yes stop_codon:yes gene_type:complete